MKYVGGHTDTQLRIHKSEDSVIFLFVEICFDVIIVSLKSDPLY